MKTSMIILLIQGVLIGIALIYLQRQMIKDIKNAIKEYLENTNITINQHIYNEGAKKISQDYINSESEKSSEEVVTTPIFYGITIAGVKVTSANCNNITGERITGSVSYNDCTRTLTLNDATIEGHIWINGRVENITIILVGKNNVSEYITSVNGTKTIKGSGSLKVNYLECWHEKKIIIEDCTIEIVDGEDNWAMFSGVLSEGKLTIKNANLSVQTLKVAIGNFKGIKFIGCGIVKPVNAQIIDTEYNGYAGKYICTKKGTIAKKVIIRRNKNESK